MKNHGFTLVELIISITILIVISAFAVPGVLNYQKFQNEEQFLNQVINELRTYQLSSIATDNFSNFRITENTFRICKGTVFTDCKELSSVDSLFSSSLNAGVLNTVYYIDRFGNTNKNTTQLIDNNEVKFESGNFRIKITKFGGVYKEKK